MKIFGLKVDSDAFKKQFKVQNLHFELPFG